MARRPSATLRTLSMARQFPESGDLFEDRFRIRDVVGSGGFARIFHAKQIDLNRDVALKVLEPQQLEGHDPDQTTRKSRNRGKRFRREARNVSQLRDPHTITLFDYGETDDGLLYMVFEYIDGEDLKQVSNERAPIEAERIVTIMRQVLESLEEAHNKGMLHRDIKPANIMLYEHVGRSDRVKVLDFGIAKAVLEHADKTVQDLTREGMMLGTPRYMAPEQLRGEDIGPPSDLYSLGLVAYELLAGRKAIEAESTMTIISRQVGPAPIILPFDTDIPPNLRATIHRMVAKDREERFQSTREVRKALDVWDSDNRPDWAKEWVFSDQDATTQEQRPEEHQQASVKTSPMRRPPDKKDDNPEPPSYRTEAPGDDSTTITDVSSPEYDDPDGPEHPTQPEEIPPTDEAMSIPEDARTIPSMNLPDSLSHLREDNTDESSTSDGDPKRTTAQERPDDRTSGGGDPEQSDTLGAPESYRPGQSNRQSGQQQTPKRAGAPPGLEEATSRNDDSDGFDRRALLIVAILGAGIVAVLIGGAIMVVDGTDSSPTVVPQNSATPDAGTASP